jgi:hypothetical protein
MPKELTDADMAEHRIAFRPPGRVARTVVAAYIATDSADPGMLVFKDAAHRVVYMVSREETLEVERIERGETAGDAERKLLEGGFLTTSQVLGRA